MTLPYLYRWNRQGRKGEPCEMLARGKMNSCLVRFADGYTMVTSRNAIMRNRGFCAVSVRREGRRTLSC